MGKYEFLTPCTADQSSFANTFGSSTAVTLTFAPADVPEPSSTALVSLGVGLLALIRTRFRR
jgi:hypothetical protein